MGSCSVVVPRAGDCPHRSRAWEWLSAQYEGFEVVEGYGDPNLWCKAEAVGDGLSRASGDLLVIADADVWSDHLRDAVDAVESGDAEWAAPHRRVRRLTQTGTGQFVRGERENALTSEEHQAVVGGGIVVLSRDLYERCPLDPRFVGWGGEDQAWGYALRTFGGVPWLGRQPLWHLWHPPQERMTRKVGNVANDQLRGRYAGAKLSKRRMSILLGEARCHFNASSTRPL